jgi:hypothetical protein
VAPGLVRTEMFFAEKYEAFLKKVEERSTGRIAEMTDLASVCWSRATLRSVENVERKKMNSTDTRCSAECRGRQTACILTKLA